MVLVILAACGFAFSVLIAVGEAIAERDWPRKTGWYAVGMGASLLILLSASA
jgi:hypothetical protein